MNRPDYVAKVAVIGFFVADKEILEAQVGDHSGGKEHGGYNPDDAELSGSKQPGEEHRASSPHDEIAD
jgi:hypothetical protein